MVIRYKGLMILVALCLGCAVRANDSMAEQPDSSFEEQVMRVEHEFSELVEKTQNSLTAHGHQIKADVARVLTLELLYRLARQTQAVQDKSWWSYAVRGFEAWTGLSIVSEIVASFSDARKMSNIIAARNQFRNQVLGFQQSQEIFKDSQDAAQ